MSVLDWILVASGIVAVAVFTTFQVLKFKKEKKLKAELEQENEKEQENE